jgi:hypothetical protein
MLFQHQLAFVVSGICPRNFIVRLRVLASVFHSPTEHFLTSPFHISYMQLGDIICDRRIWVLRWIYMISMAWWWCISVDLLARLARIKSLHDHQPTCSPIIYVNQWSTDRRSKISYDVNLHEFYPYLPIIAWPLCMNWYGDWSHQISFGDSRMRNAHASANAEIKGGSD